MATAQDGRRQLEPVLRLLFDGAEHGEWRKCVVTPGSGAKHLPWLRLTAQPVRLSKGAAVKLVTRTAKGEATSTLSLDAWPDRLDEAIEAGPCHLDVMARDHDWHARRTRDGRWLVTRSKPSSAVPPGAAVPGPAPHDRTKQVALPPDDERVVRLFTETGLYGKNGRLLGEAAPKYRQVQHYIELLRALSVWERGRTVRVVDAGCGKAYLSLALCLWAELNGSKVELTGIDTSHEVIETVRGIAGRTGLSSATFVAAPIAEFAASHTGPVDLLLSLHACDTATDEALAAGVRLGAEAIVLVPCCHAELAAQLEPSAKSGSDVEPPSSLLLKHGLIRHRLADLLTDSLRAAALEALGYSVSVAEFVSPEATARNLMIRAERRRPSAARAATALADYEALAREWRVKPALEALLGDRWPPRAT